MATWLKVSVTTTGADGSATGNTDVPISQHLRGHLLSVYIPTNAALPNTSDVTVRHLLPDGAYSNMVVFTNVAAAITRRVQVLVYDQAGTVTTVYGDEYAERLNVLIAQANAGTINVWLLVE